MGKIKALQIARDDAILALAKAEKDLVEALCEEEYDLFRLEEDARYKDFGAKIDWPSSDRS
tara:strand:- start:1108 stop:1290 length:183 start_codon:yes stop_codon:yes gene_type:complete